MEAYKKLVETHEKTKKNGDAGNHNKDKLASSKQREKEVKESLRQESQRKKDAHTAERAERQALLKEERLTHDSKRAAKDRREAAKREQHAETGATCEHGVWRCRVCFPHGQSTDKAPRATPRVIAH